MIYSINYDLKKPGRDYSGLYNAIQSCGDWWHFLESTWLVDTSLDASGIWKRIEAHIDPNDFVLVIGVTRDYQGWLSEEAWNWINDHRSRAAA